MVGKKLLGVELNILEQKLVNQLLTIFTMNQQKFGFRNWQGGGRSSARETIGRVAAGAVAKKLLKQRFGVEVLSYVKQVRKIVADINPDKVKLHDVESNIVRCPDPAVADKMIRLIDRTRKAGDTVGGIIEGVELA